MPVITDEPPALPPAQLELDHIFVFVTLQDSETKPKEATLLEQAGLQESYRRAHPGQGTTNICYCFDNCYLELLWLTNEQEARSPLIARTALAERAHWKTNGASPFGLALRRTVQHPFPLATWDYLPPYLPPGMTIPVSLSSQDPLHPFIFQSPGGKRPDQWENSNRQNFSDLDLIELQLPQDEGFSEDLEKLRQISLIPAITYRNTSPGMQLSIKDLTGRITHHLQLPSCRITPAPAS
ncbi:VOC family protein [Kiloniella laminariae]|uniref:VOC family protein n=1 Tax=Kiloniella laminariae TaxID=454162 RepID=A0ABT4LQL2_9PROT|nr:VOC family protein [Kiloniella laminariae]MCZ4282222.1 VOC family protein [Kiloniella laminariae]